MRSLDVPRAGRALDVAGGSGRHAVWLAQRGLDVTLVDVSPVGVDLAQRRAAFAGVTINTIVADLETEPLPAGPWDLIVDINYLDRALFDAFARELAPGGWLVFCQPTITNLERHPRPDAPFLLQPDEARTLVAGLDLVSYDERWFDDDGRHQARVVARRPHSHVAT